MTTSNDDDTRSPLVCKHCGKLLEVTENGFGLCPDGFGKLQPLDPAIQRELARLNEIRELGTLCVVKRERRGASVRHSVNGVDVKVVSKPRTIRGAASRFSRGFAVGFLESSESLELAAFETPPEFPEQDRGSNRLRVLAAPVESEFSQPEFSIQGNEGSE